jgi:hypothetical protein
MGPSQAGDVATMVLYTIGKIWQHKSRLLH